MHQRLSNLDEFNCPNTFFFLEYSSSILPIEILPFLQIYLKFTFTEQSYWFSKTEYKLDLFNRVDVNELISILFDFKDLSRHRNVFMYLYGYFYFLLFLAFNLFIKFY